MSDPKRAEAQQTAETPAPDLLDEIQAEVAKDLEDEKDPGGTAYQVVGALVGLALGVGGIVLSLGYGLGTLREPGAGMWPLIVSVLITVLSAALLVVGRTLDDSERFRRASLLPAVGAATFVALAFLMPVIGFEIPALLLCVVWLRFLGGETWRSTIVVSVVTVAAFYALFLYGLRVPLPHLFAF
ncbi:tripartite tricarboxylate transporter TctB family protein [Nocardioides sp. CFH 31398]|uniref:tripartite tricarboxylate transporter TctB family protein n=1 Tax=Nocardioides sp. CFH 31398 TaxID=2919579 RepID=UPI001F06EC12|nr:tripartite tricarboxylate transporter TctB family protein [Nocardioides sp. CFH 31398]MCH1868778.1 tripartite tricarboxylate transporter TctB family protein [Nocardioides sp. CFH 31398]